MQTLLLPYYIHLVHMHLLTLTLYTDTTDIQAFRVQMRLVQLAWGWVLTTHVLPSDRVNNIHKHKQDYSAVQIVSHLVC